MNERAPRNRTLTCSAAELESLAKELLRLAAAARPEEVIGRVIHQDFHDARRFLPSAFAELVILDPPYNLTKNYNGHVFQAKEAEAYTRWFDEILCSLMPLLRPSATVYACSDWQTSTLIFPETASRGKGKRDVGPRQTGKITPRTSGFVPSATTATSMSRP
jgi:site-specific DNA-methyltransferase (adenine-specific)